MLKPACMLDPELNGLRRIVVVGKRLDLLSLRWLVPSVVLRAGPQSGRLTCRTNKQSAGHVSKIAIFARSVKGSFCFEFFEFFFLP